MRTFTVTQEVQQDATSKLVVSTEVIVADDAEVAQAGEEAMRALVEFVGGMNDEGEGG